MTTFKEGWLYFWRAYVEAQTLTAWMGFVVAVVAGGVFWALAHITGDLLKALWNAA